MAYLARGGLLLGTALVIAQGAPGVTAIGPVRRHFFPGLAGQGRAEHVALTFDDGPDSATTPNFLAALERAQVRATFFMLGPMARRARPLAAAIAALGGTAGGIQLGPRLARYGREIPRARSADVQTRGVTWRGHGPAASRPASVTDPGT